MANLFYYRSRNTSDAECTGTHRLSRCASECVPTGWRDTLSRDASRGIHAAYAVCQTYTYAVSIHPDLVDVECTWHNLETTGEGC